MESTMTKLEELFQSNRERVLANEVPSLDELAEMCRLLLQENLETPAPRASKAKAATATLEELIGNLL